jgi:hypothetical protein
MRFQLLNFVNNSRTLLRKAGYSLKKILNFDETTCFGNYVRLMQFHSLPLYVLNITVA